MFFPAMQYGDFAKQFLIEAKDFTTVLPDLYLKRGDANAALKQTQKANGEYDRCGSPKLQLAVKSIT
jgi:hypothetical protein